MLSRDEVATLLTLQQQAYTLLMWLADAATTDPRLLSPRVVRELRHPDTALAWLERTRSHLPAHLLPEDAGGAFINLLSSFFDTSFQVTHLEFIGRLMESRVTAGAEAPTRDGAGLEQCQILALRHLASAEKIPVSERDARFLVSRRRLEEASLLWTYAWELERRSRDRGKGSVVHKIWRKLPMETRKGLSVDAVWQARETLLSAAKEHLQGESAA